MVSKLLLQRSLEWTSGAGRWGELNCPVSRHRLRHAAQCSTKDQGKARLPLPIIVFGDTRNTTRASTSFPSFFLLDSVTTFLKTPVAEILLSSMNLLQANRDWFTITRNLHYLRDVILAAAGTQAAIFCISEVEDCLMAFQRTNKRIIE